MAPGDMIAGKTVEGNDHQRILDLEERIKALEAQIAEISQRNYLMLPTNPANYTVTASTDRTLAAASDTLPNGLNVLGTLINDFISLGLLQ